MESGTLETDDPRAHAGNIVQMLIELIEHVRDDIERVIDPKAQVLFETSAEVLIGLRTACEHFRGRSEKAMK